MNPDDPLYHAAPLVWLTKQVLHKDTTLADRVRQLRYKRRKAKPVTVTGFDPASPDGDVAVKVEAELVDGKLEIVKVEEQPAGQAQEVGS